MNEFKRCISVFEHSPLQVRLQLLGMICNLLYRKPRQDDKSPRQ